MFSGDSTEASGGAGPGAGVTVRDTDRIIEQFLDGRPDAVRLVAGWARSVAVHKAWGFDTPEDVVQATLLAVVQNLRLERFTGGNLPAYVRRIAKNKCVTNYRRSRTRGDVVPFEETTQSPDTHLTGDNVERRVMLDQVLGRLGEACRRIVLLAYIQGYSRKEIGKQLGISEQAARVKLFRCIQDARASLDGFDGVDAERA